MTAATSKNSKGDKAEKTPQAASKREQYREQRTQRVIARDKQAAAKLAARIALASDPKLRCKARMQGYAAALDDRDVETNPFAGRIPSFADAWAHGYAAAVADLEAFAKRDA